MIPSEVLKNHVTDFVVFIQASFIILTIIENYSVDRNVRLVPKTNVYLTFNIILSLNQDIN